MTPHPLAVCRMALEHALVAVGAPPPAERLVLQPALRTTMTLTTNAADLAGDAPLAALLAALDRLGAGVVAEARPIGRRLAIRLHRDAVVTVVMALRALPMPDAQAADASALVLHGTGDASHRLIHAASRCRSVLQAAPTRAPPDAAALYGDLPQPLHDLMLLMLFRPPDVSTSRHRRYVLLLCHVLEAAWRAAPPNTILRSLPPLGAPEPEASAHLLLIDLALRLLAAEAAHAGLRYADTLL